MERACRLALCLALVVGLCLVGCAGGGGGGGKRKKGRGKPESLAPEGAPGGLPTGPVVAPATLTLDGSSLTAPAGSGLVITGLTWSWGDGSASESTGPADAPTHTYSTAGAFTLTITAVYDDGSSGSRSFGITVTGSCAAITTFEDGKSPTLEIHVDVDSGSDQTGDGTAGNPYRSISRGAQDLVPGAALRIHSGVYAGGTFLSGITGTASAPVWIGGAPGEARAVISGGGEGLHLTRVRFLVVHDLEVVGAANNGINCDDGGDYADPDATRFVIFRGLVIHDIGSGDNQDCLKLSGVDDYVVLDCHFEDGSAGGSGIDHVGCHSGLIARCRFERMGTNGVQVKGGSEDVEIRWCTFVDSGARGINIGGSTGAAYFRPPLSTSDPNYEAKNVRVLGNSFRGGDTAFAFVGAVDCVAAHNTIVTPDNWLFRILMENTGDQDHAFLETADCEVTNNLWYYDRSDLRSEYVNIGANTRPDTFAYRNNLWFAHDD
ncbi:MAG: right-handed parallel beta-helix repeat-containing protein, partial [Planctomycetota bacterium]